MRFKKVKIIEKKKKKNKSGYWIFENRNFHIPQNFGSVLLAGFPNQFRVPRPKSISVRVPKRLHH